MANPDVIQWVRYMHMGRMRAYTCMYTYIHTYKYIYIHYTVIYVLIYIYRHIHALLHAMLTLGVLDLEEHDAGNNLSQCPDCVSLHTYWDS